MRVQFSTILALLGLSVAGCVPQDKCGGQLVYDPIALGCRPCPKDAVFRDESCECPAQQQYVNGRCRPVDGAPIDESDSGVSADAGQISASCGDYCGFVKVCIADNPVAAAAVPDVIMGLLHGADTSACADDCRTVVADDGSSDPVVACIAAGRENAACAGDTTQVGLLAALGLLGDCCGPRRDNALCKSICETLSANPLAKSQIDFCE